METGFTNWSCQVTNPGALSGDFPDVLARELGTLVGCHSSFWVSCVFTLDLFQRLFCKNWFKLKKYFKTWWNC